MDARLINVVQVGVAFLCIFAALNSSSFIVETVINEFANSGRVDRHDGYVSSSIIYLFFTFASFIAAPLTTILGAKWAMVYAACAYAVYQCGFLFLNQPFLYASSALMGVGAAVLWTAQGKYMCLNSTDETAGRNSGIFWAISQACLIFGGIFMFAVFYANESPSIPERTVRVIYGGFTGLSVVGVVILALLIVPSTAKTPAVSNMQTVQVQSAEYQDNDGLIADEATGTSAVSPASPAEVVAQPIVESTFRQQLRVIQGTLRLGRTRRMGFMIVAFAYTGLILSFWSGIYPTCIASTLLLDYNTKCLLALNAITQGIGQAVSGFLFGILSSKTKRLGRHRIVALGAIVHFVTFVVVFINFPPEAPLRKTDSAGFIQPSIPLALLCGFALGFGDACWNTQIYAHLIANYQSASAEAFCLFRFFHSLFAAISFYYSKLVALPWHLAILTIGGLISVVGFYVSDKQLAGDPSPLPAVGERDSHED